MGFGFGFDQMLDDNTAVPDAATQNFTSLTNPAESAPVVSPPKTPEEHAQRVSGWQAFLQRLNTDPQMQDAAFHVAAKLSEGRKPGQSTTGVITQALSSGQDYLRLLRTQEATTKRQAEVDALHAKNVNSEIAARQVQSDATKQSTGQSADLFPAKLAGAQFESSPEMQKATLEGKKASAAHALASAASASENARGEAQKRTQMKEIWDGMSSADRVAFAANPGEYGKGLVAVSEIMQADGVSAQEAIKRHRDQQASEHVKSETSAIATLMKTAIDNENDPKKRAILIDQLKTYMATKLPATPQGAGKDVVVPVKEWLAANPVKGAAKTTAMPAVPANPDSAPDSAPDPRAKQARYLEILNLLQQPFLTFEARMRLERERDALSGQAHISKNF